MNDAPLLSLEQVGIQYRSGGFGGVGQTVHRVLDEVSLDLRPGEVLSLLGQSGSGKTSLARAIMGLVPLQSGRISYGGRVIRVAGAAYRNRGSDLWRQIQLVPQGTGNSLPPGFSVRRTLTDILSRAETPPAELDERVARILDICGLDLGHLESLPGQLSGGQRQRLLIARALAVEPRVLLLDEPVASLDVSIQARILNPLSRLRTELGLTLLLITHDLDIAEYMGDRMAIIHDGSIIESGRVDEMVSNPQTAFVRGLMSSGLAKSRWLRDLETGDRIRNPQ